jgi:4,5-dihydroxyphthalate decarboxylase
VSTKLKLKSMLGNYPNTAALLNGSIRSDLVEFEFADVKVANTAFKRFVRDAEFDFGELAIVTFLQAKAYDKPYVPLPAVVVGRGQLHTIAYNAERGHLSPSDLPGRRVGVRAYTVTTGVWVRGMLAELYGLDIDRVRWVTFEEPHVAEYRDPETVERAPAGKELVKMLLDGELDAGIVGDKLPDPRLKTLVPDAEAANRKWAETHGGVPINHVAVVRTSIARERPDVVRELYRLLAESKRVANLPESGTALDPLRFGVEPNRRTLEIIIDFAYRQKLIPRRFSVDELFEDTARALAA